VKLHQLAVQSGAKSIQLIEIAKVLGLTNPNGGTPLTAEQQTEIVACFRYMRDRQIVDAKAAIAQMQAAESTSTEEIPINLRASVADELCRRYPDGSMSDRILKLLGAVSALETLHLSYRQHPAAEPAEV
jgi:hypothetical protein